MAKMPKVLNHERQELKCHRCYIMSVEGQNSIGVTSLASGAKNGQNAKGVTT
ncbi:hypothetical protein COLO4_23861 [Corchorus olitorius]|uniref:Uncharacterized protein n=1 Tax=Corchorus olitorius TaxID=93759 RepID=A0A1R3IEB5_9ROSI|nr:hypothetical protein COLO4_23861 [Corchorus olitorius]